MGRIAEINSRKANSKKEENAVRRHLRAEKLHGFSLLFNGKSSSH